MLEEPDMRQKFNDSANDLPSTISYRKSSNSPVALRYRTAFTSNIASAKHNRGGVVGRRAFHIFDKTNRTWITNSKELGYQKLAEIQQDND